MQLEGLIAKGVEEAKEYIKAKRRERALLALRKNKLYEQSADKIDAYLLNVEQVPSHPTSYLPLVSTTPIIHGIHTCIFLSSENRWLSQEAPPPTNASTQETTNAKCESLCLTNQIVSQPVTAPSMRAASTPVLLQILANIETAQRTNRLFTVLKEGNAAMAELQQQVSLEDVEKLNEETAEAKDYQERVNEMLSQSLSAQDDAEALEELEEIQVSVAPACLLKLTFHAFPSMHPSSE